MGIVPGDIDPASHNIGRAHPIDATAFRYGDAGLDYPGARLDPIARINMIVIGAICQGKTKGSASRNRRKPSPRRACSTPHHPPTPHRELLNSSMVRLWRKLAGGVGQVKGSFHPNSVSFTPLMTRQRHCPGWRTHHRWMLRRGPWRNYKFCRYSLSACEKLARWANWRQISTRFFGLGFLFNPHVVAPRRPKWFTPVTATHRMATATQLRPRSTITLLRHTTTQLRLRSTITRLRPRQERPLLS